MSYIISSYPTDYIEGACLHQLSYFQSGQKDNFNEYLSSIKTVHSLKNEEFCNDLVEMLILTRFLTFLVTLLN